MTPSQVESLTEWAIGLDPTEEDNELAHRSLVDTAAVAFAAQGSETVRFVRGLGTAGALAALAHVLDFDDLHIPSTAHVSAVCVPTTIASSGGTRAFLAGAGVMARIGIALGWAHYSRGWHATCTAGAPGAAVAASIAHGLSADETAHALALSLPAAGGVQDVFGTQGKSMQVGYSADAGVRAAELAALGVRTDLRSFDTWLDLMGGDIVLVATDGPTIPGGLAIKVFPCCYALQRPMRVASLLAEQGVTPEQIASIKVVTPKSSLQPLIHEKPATGLEAKFSLQYGVAAALIDHPEIGFETFSDGAIGREDVERLRSLITVETSGEGVGLLDGETSITLVTRDGDVRTSVLASPPGAPGTPLSGADLRRKVEVCASDDVDLIMSLTWETAASTLVALLDGNDA